MLVCEACSVVPISSWEDFCNSKRKASHRTSHHTVTSSRHKQTVCLCDPSSPQRTYTRALHALLRCLQITFHQFRCKLNSAHIILHLTSINPSWALPLPRSEETPTIFHLSKHTEIHQFYNTPQLPKSIPLGNSVKQNRLLSSHLPPHFLQPVCSQFWWLDCHHREDLHS